MDKLGSAAAALAHIPDPPTAEDWCKLATDRLELDLITLAPGAVVTPTLGTSAVRASGLFAVDRVALKNPCDELEGVPMLFVVYHLL